MILHYSYARWQITQRAESLHSMWDSDNTMVSACGKPCPWESLGDSHAPPEGRGAINSQLGPGQQQDSRQAAHIDGQNGDTILLGRSRHSRPAPV